ncbi:MAG TPA: KpsF/GutQ family sugar-phosphate isomerase [Nitrospiria bacterium]|nr:KpsF/GutQ family sugar-phosphate isomerase [Nitrospiria bacterium]
MIIDDGKRVLQIEADAIRALVDRMDERFERAVGICYACTGRIVVTGMGKSGLIAKKISATLASTGTTSFFLHPAEGIHGDLGMVSKEDVFIALSNSGETEEVVRLLPSIKRLNLQLISLTGNTRSTLAKMSDVALDVGVKEEACPLGLAPTASTTAALAMGDALSIALLQKRGFQREDYAVFHPGGALGKRLLLRVFEAMHRGEGIPVVHEETPMKEVILEITSKKLGVTTVQDERGRLIGVITDGDLRRLFQRFFERESQIFKLRAADVMTRGAKVIQKEALAAQAVQIMEKHSITSLVVIGQQERVEGIVHLHDLLKLGVV